MPYTGTVSITVNNSIHPELTIGLFDSVFNSPGFVVQNFGSTSVTFNGVISGGDYYLRISAIAEAASYLYPYDFTIEASTLASAADIDVQPLSVVLYPNPVKTQLTIDAKDIQNASEIDIINLLGESVYKSDLTDHTVTIDASTFPRGVYIAKIIAGNKPFMRKFIKEQYYPFIPVNTSFIESKVLASTGFMSDATIQRTSVIPSSVCGTNLPV